MEIIISKYNGKMEIDVSNLKYLVITLGWNLVDDEMSPADWMWKLKSSLVDVEINLVRSEICGPVG